VEKDILVAVGFLRKRIYSWEKEIFLGCDTYPWENLGKTEILIFNL